MVQTIHADPSLTISRVLASVETVESEMLARILLIPDSKEEELKKQSTTDEDFKHGVATYYLSTHPSASWAHIGNLLLWWEEEKALEKVKELIVPKQGIQGMGQDAGVAMSVLYDNFHGGEGLLCTNGLFLW